MNFKPWACLTQEALLALNEAVRIAQQQNDNSALAHALAALCHILASAAPAAVTHLTEPGTAAAHPSGHLSQLLKILKRYGSGFYYYSWVCVLVFTLMGLRLQPVSGTSHGC